MSAFFDIFSWLTRKTYTTPDTRNLLPTLGSIGNQTVSVGETLTITLTSTSPQSYTPTYSVIDAPTSSTLVDNIFTWTPEVDDEGITTLTFTVTDAGGSDSETITITVVVWSTSILPLLRVLIEDYTIPYTHTTSFLHQAICVAAITVQQEMDFDNDYTVDLATFTISPEPTETAFINLVALFSAYIIGMGESRIDSGSAVQVKDGEASIDMKDVAQTKMAWAKELYKMYRKSLKAYKLGKYALGHSIVSPYKQ